MNTLSSDRLSRALDFSLPMQAPAPSTNMQISPPGVRPSHQDSAVLTSSAREPEGQAAPAHLMNSLAANWAGNDQIAQESARATPVGPKAPTTLRLPKGFESLERLGSELAKRDPRFTLETADGRSAHALAAAIGGTEVYTRGTKKTDFFTRMGGTGDRMKGFAQFNQAYHSGKTSSPARYTRSVADILTGKASMPNGTRGSNHASALTQAVQSDQIKNGKDLIRFMKQRGFGGSNWQGIDDGWARNPGLADGLVNFLKNSGK